MQNWKAFVLGIIAGVAAVCGCVFLYFRFGFAPVAVSSQPMPFETYLAQTGLRSVTNRAGAVPSPVPAAESNLMTGANTYRNACAECHGLPNMARTSVQQNMFPSPPSLLSGKGVTDDPVGRTHWVVANGIRMTGMPAFQNLYSDEELWDVSQLLAHAGDLPPAVLEMLDKPDAVPVTAAAKTH